MELKNQSYEAVVKMVGKTRVITVVVEEKWVQDVLEDSAKRT